MVTASHVTQRVSRDLNWQNASRISSVIATTVDYQPTTSDLVRVTNALIRERASQMVTKADEIKKRRGSYPFTVKIVFHISILERVTLHTHFLKHLYHRDQEITGYTTAN